MDNERRKYFKDMINKCTSEVKWKKKEALQKTKTNLDKENSKVFSTKIENQYTVCTSNQEVTVADVHQDPTLNIKKCNDEIDTETSLKTQNCEITIELEEVEADKNEISLYNEQDSEDIIPHAKSEFTETIQIVESEYFSQSKYNKIMTRRYNKQKGDEAEDSLSLQECHEPDTDACCTVQEFDTENNDLQNFKQQENEGGVLTRTQSDELQATITDIIPDEQMEIIRKSLEEENNEISLPDADNKNDTDAKTKKRQKRLTNLKKNYADFLSEEEDFVWDSTSWKDTDEESTSSGEILKKKRKKSKNDKGSADGKVGDKGLKKKKENKRRKEKEARQRGKSFVKKDGTIVPEKKMQVNPSAGTKCGHNCGEVSEEKRSSLFNFFWNLSSSKRKDWLVSMSNKLEIKRKRVKDSGYRANTFEYFINDGEGRRQVCLKFILKTLNISQKYVYYTLSNATYGLSKEDGRGKTIPANKTSAATRESVIKYIKNLPALPSHYCRKETTRVYLPVEYKNLKNVYRIYKEDRTSQCLDVVSENIFRDIFNKEFNIGFHVPTRESVIKYIKNLPALPSHYCRKETTRVYLPVEYKNLKNVYRIYKEDRTSQCLDVVSENIFRDIFNKEFNIGFHVPKKDKCVRCLRFETNPNDFVEEKQEHLDEKLASKTRLNFHRDLGKDNQTILCTSFDLQKVLNTPHGNSILLFYTRKYAVYNLCFYENVTREGYCYLWGESDAKRGGNEVSTILEKYISTVDMRGTVKHLILYSDSCPGQNKNRIVMAAVHNALSKSKNLESIQLNYLLPGHTEMSVDSMHSVIEHSVRNTTVWAPSQWLTVCQVARKEVSPYHVQWLDYTDFKNYEEFSDKYYKGNLTGKISKIRIATFKKSALQNIKIKFSMKDGSPEEVIPVNAKQKAIVAKPLYKSILPVTKSKYNDLKKLCETGVIPKIFHREYLSLPYGNGKDVLIDTDIEDSENEENE